MAYHCLYLFLYHNQILLYTERNHLKWVEYATSATFGMLAVAATNGHVMDPSMSTVLIGASSVTQSCGAIIELDVGGIAAKIAFISAVTLQIVEFVAVENNMGIGGTAGYHFATYAMTYSLFGYLMLAIMVCRTKRVSDPEVSEILFSFLGAFAKISVVCAEVGDPLDVYLGAVPISIMFICVVGYLAAVDVTPTESL